MGLWARLRWRIRRRTATTQHGSRRVSASRPALDAGQEDALRAELQEDPNNVEAFDALVALIRRHTSEVDAESDPLHAPNGEQDAVKEKADAATWAAAEEFAGHTQAWYPLLELARLSIDDDLEAACRRLATAADRDPSGTALADGVALLRRTGHPVDALGLGIGHWRTMSHVPRVGEQLVLAALEADRVVDARRFCGSLAQHPDQEATAPVLAGLEPLVAAAERRASVSHD